MNPKIALARTDDEIQSCYAVMVELRPHVPSREFRQRIKRQIAIAGYQLVYFANQEVKAVAGFRISECLAWGKFLYVDDLVSKGTDRAKGYGGALIDWLIDYARAERCDQFHLDSAVHRFDAHRLYMKKRMFIAGHHFALLLTA